MLTFARKKRHGILDAECHLYQRLSPREGKQRHELHKRGLNSKLPLETDTHEMPVKFVLSEGDASNCLFAETPISDTVVRPNRDIAIRYTKKLASFAATIEIRIIVMWFKIWG